MFGDRDLAQRARLAQTQAMQRRVMDAGIGQDLACGEAAFDREIAVGDMHRHLGARHDHALQMQYRIVEAAAAAGTHEELQTIAAAAEADLHPGLATLRAQQRVGDGDPLQTHLVRREVAAVRGVDQFDVGIGRQQMLAEHHMFAKADVGVGRQRQPHRELAFGIEIAAGVVGVEIQRFVALAELRREADAAAEAGAAAGDRGAGARYGCGRGN